MTLAQKQGLLKAGGHQRSDSTHVLGAMRAMTRLEVVTETLRHTLNVLATVKLEWLCTHTTAAWVDRYDLRASEYRLPKSQAKRVAWAEQVGTNGTTLLEALFTRQVPCDLHTLPAVETLRQVWIQNFLVVDDILRWRENAMVPPAARYITAQIDGNGSMYVVLLVQLLEE